MPVFNPADSGSGGSPFTFWVSDNLPITVGWRGLVAPASAIIATTPNDAKFAPLIVDAPITFTALYWQNGATVNGNVCVAIYDAGFNRLFTTGNVAQAGASTPQIVGISWALTPGVYWVGFQTTSTTATFLRWLIGSAAGRLMGAGIRTQSAPTNPLPATVAPIYGATNTDRDFNLPIFGLLT